MEGFERTRNLGNGWPTLHLEQDKHTLALVDTYMMYIQEDVVSTTNISHVLNIFRRPIHVECYIPNNTQGLRYPVV